jgi:hypothetical protein
MVATPIAAAHHAEAGAPLPSVDDREGEAERVHFGANTAEFHRSSRARRNQNDSWHGAIDCGTLDAMLAFCWHEVPPCPR